VSGHHEAVRRWRLEASLRRTIAQRPDLLEGRELSAEERRILDRLRAGE
jgi:tRNA (guanine37-N1)-methyltransferase